MEEKKKINQVRFEELRSKGFPKCAAKARDIMWNSTEKKAVYLTKMLVTMAENLDSVM